jgi:hypothetical protein
LLDLRNKDFGQIVGAKDGFREKRQLETIPQQGILSSPRNLRKAPRNKTLRDTEVSTTRHLFKEIHRQSRAGGAAAISGELWVVLRFFLWDLISTSRIAVALTQKTTGLCEGWLCKATMVILAAAAVTAAGVGAYQGGKAAVADVGKRMRRRTMAKERDTERKVEQSQREQARKLEETKKQNTSIEDRVARFKQGMPSEQKRSGLFRKCQS